LIGLYYLPQFFRVKLAGERGGAHEALQ